MGRFQAHFKHPRYVRVSRVNGHRLTKRAWPAAEAFVVPELVSRGLQLTQGASCPVTYDERSVTFVFRPHTALEAMELAIVNAGGA